MKWSSSYGATDWRAESGVFDLRVGRRLLDDGWFWNVRVQSRYLLSAICHIAGGEAPSHHEAMRVAELALARVLVDALLALKP